MVRPLALVVVAAAAGRSPDAPDFGARPHIVFILADDLGWANVGFHRPKGFLETSTPTLDALRASGAELARHYVHPFCSPSRCALQTGRLPVHVNVNNYDPYMRNADDPDAGFSGVPRGMTGIAAKVAVGGYETYFAGKWDAGMATEDHTPLGRGYRHSLHFFHHYNDYYTSEAGRRCGTSGGVRPRDLWSGTAPAPWAANPPGACRGWPWPENTTCAYEDDVFADQVEAWVRAHDASTPLFLCWATHAPHSPYEVPESAWREMAQIPDKRRRIYAAMVANVDAGVGRLVAALKDRDMWQRTLLVFSSDNGGPISQWANNWPLRGGKHSHFDGGVRAAALVAGGFLPPPARGGTVRSLVSIADWYATFCHLAGVDSRDDRAEAAGLPPVDGVSVWPVLAGRVAESPRLDLPLGTCANSRRDVFCAGAQPGRTKVAGLVMTDSASGKIFKLLVGLQPLPVWTRSLYPDTDARPDLHAWLDCGSGGCLFDLDADPTERANLNESDKHASLLRAMRERLMEHDTSTWTPDRGSYDLAGACAAALGRHGGFWGPWV